MKRGDNERFLGQGNPSFIGRVPEFDVRSSLSRRDGPVVNFEDENLRALFYLFQEKGLGTSRLTKEDFEKIAADAIAYPGQIQLVDFVDQIGLSKEVVAAIHQQQDTLVPDERRPFFQRYERAVSTIPSISEAISGARLNPFTQFENQPPLLFGMGGGSRALNKGFPIDILNMVLTAEKLRRELGLGRCRVICANQITYTNIPNNPGEFSRESIDRVMATERDLLQLVVERFGIGGHWDIFLESDVEQIIGRELKDEYDRIVADADTVPFIGGHHYAMEMAQMHTLINQERGGVKLGWFMRPLNTVRPEYIMDEQPFDARYTLYLAHRRLTNRVSIPYVRAGVKLYPSEKGMVNKEPPYICYNPSDRILLSPFEDPVQKLSTATEAGGGLQLRQVKGHFTTIISLFEEIVIARREQLPTKGHNEPILRRVTIGDLLGEEVGRYRAGSEYVGKQLQYILDYIFEGHRAEAERLYKGAFAV